MATRRKERFTPPDHLADDVRAVWEQVVANDRIASTVTPDMLEAYCSLVVRHRDAAAQVASDGIVVREDERKPAVVHPALAAERQLADQLKDWAPLFNQQPAVRKRGPLYDETKRSLKAAGLEEKEEFAGASAAVLTLAWLIDEAQRAGIEALQKASYVIIPTYLKGCAALQITPASLPPSVGKKVPGGKLAKFQDQVTKRRESA